MIKKLRLDKYSALYLWALFMIVFTILKRDPFLTTQTLHLQLTEYALKGTLALAFLVPLATGTFDLSIGAMAGLSLSGAAVLNQRHGWNPVVSMFVMIAACAALGAVSGFFVVKLRVNSFIATLGMSQIATAIIQFMSKGETISSAFGGRFYTFGNTKFLGQELYVYVFFLLAVIVWFVFEHTPVGRYMFATGGNPEAARLAGVRTDRLIWRSLIASAAMAAVVGVMQSWKVGLAPTTFGPGLLFPAIAAVYFGASQLKGRPNVVGMVIALYCLAWGVKGLQLTVSGQQTWLEPAFEGVSLLAAVSLAARNGIIKVKRKKSDDAPAAGSEPAAGSASPA